ncbi:hypothetical protein KCG44_01860 [Pacificimonas sp. WHA3]|uniref:Lipoprotein n=1 Tax=Pacificimonas pallii TaxID=2827236 RepID=A0ABS6SBC6_9SPHN|nr:hypothetical protein [Pacificimonas pallii]MBV7255525.1 hypothetical protein [Pacificimonas pallii]
MTKTPRTHWLVKVLMRLKISVALFALTACDFVDTALNNQKILDEPYFEFPYCLIYSDKIGSRLDKYLSEEYDKLANISRFINDKQKECETRYYFFEYISSDVLERRPDKYVPSSALVIPSTLIPLQPMMLDGGDPAPLIARIISQKGDLFRLLYDDGKLPKQCGKFGYAIPYRGGGLRENLICGYSYLGYDEPVAICFIDVAPMLDTWVGWQVENCLRSFISLRDVEELIGGYSE